MMDDLTPVSGRDLVSGTLYRDELNRSAERISAARFDGFLLGSLVGLVGATLMLVLGILLH